VHLLDDDESVEERAAIEAEIDAGLAELDAGQTVDEETVRAMIRAYR
jgi:predicted transcriptional regulator